MDNGTSFHRQRVDRASGLESQPERDRQPRRTTSRSWPVWRATSRMPVALRLGVAAKILRLGSRLERVSEPYGVKAGSGFTHPGRSNDGPSYGLLEHQHPWGGLARWSRGSGDFCSPDSSPSSIAPGSNSVSSSSMRRMAVRRYSQVLTAVAVSPLIVSGGEPCTILDRVSYDTLTSPRMRRRSSGEWPRKALILSDERNLNSSLASGVKSDSSPIHMSIRALASIERPASASQRSRATASLCRFLVSFSFSHV